ncbi:unnamed protein product [Phytophthora lilii]|uniref:Unnamed protein product n=1 Tax=Phytophthora lilii TaxID=2077276 RepID=A0A9W7CU83_9STRA|nr:unnamed protein product [Phytophthora lilii]
MNRPLALNCWCCWTPMPRAFVHAQLESVLALSNKFYHSGISQPYRVVSVSSMQLQQLTAWALALVWATAFAAAKNATTSSTTYPTKSGIKPWVDPDTPKDRQTYISSRGRKWDLVMSDEFNVANRSFRPGDDHIWTSLEKPDGVNGALELYSHSMTSTMCDDDY